MTSADETLGGLLIDDDSLLRWQESLDALERGVSSTLGLPLAKLTPYATAASLADLDPWEPPTGLGPLPEILVARARDVAALQQRAVGRIAAARAGVEQEMAALNREHRQVQPVYVDVTG